jgi:hypothetical protein
VGFGGVIGGDAELIFFFFLDDRKPRYRVVSSRLFTPRITGGFGNLGIGASFWVSWLVVWFGNGKKRTLAMATAVRSLHLGVSSTDYAR